MRENKVFLAIVFVFVCTYQLCEPQSAKTVNLTVCEGPTNFTIAPSNKETIVVIQRICSEMKGEKGEQGPRGPVGPRKGIPGDKGAKGEPGSNKGQKGEKGIVGKSVKGGPGEKGEPGKRGEKGVIGNGGPKGDQGSRGENGNDGRQGIKGNMGEKGQKGEIGATGSKGSLGREGYAGAKGEKGDRGDNGYGTKGEKGNIGLTGQKAEKGSKGEPATLQNVLDSLYDLGTLNCRSGKITGASCKDIFDNDPTCRPGYYQIGDITTGLFWQYCNENIVLCGSEGGWRLMANINMTNPEANCPSSLRVITSTHPPRRACARTVDYGCSEVTFPVHDLQYTEVCGHVRGYQHGNPDAFRNYGQKTWYADGIAITHGTPRKHLWSYVAGVAEDSFYLDNGCPCAVNRTFSYLKPFIGSNYFCESGITLSVIVVMDQKGHTQKTYWNDPLWDGQGCPTNNQCCARGNYGWFYRNLNNMTSEDITVHWCGDENRGKEDVYTDIVEIYVR